MGKKIGVLLSGCGVYDGSEIHEATLTLLYLSQLGADIVCIAPNKLGEVVDHTKNQPVSEKRNAMFESARISRGEILDAARARSKDFGGLIIPGGQGSIKNLSNFYIRGSGCSVDTSVGKVIAGIVDLKRPVRRHLYRARDTRRRPERYRHQRRENDDRQRSCDREENRGDGQVHVECTPDNCVIDEEHKIVTTPAYMLAKSIKEIQPGIEKLVKAVYEMASEA